MRFFAGIAMLALLQTGNTYAENGKLILPEMVKIPAGKFMMGSPADEPGRVKNEDPRHLVTIAKPFAVSKYEVTFAEWDLCVADGGCNGYKAEDYGWGRDKRPVVDVNWGDTQAYITWLNKRSGRKFRLLSEAEWEYAARAGTTTTYYWGSEVGTNNANCKGCGSEYDNKQTAPVGSFKPNAFGLYDMAGNAWEWTQDLYHKTYDGAPTDGSAWEDEKPAKSSGAEDERPPRRMLRGGSWREDPVDMRSAHRTKFIATVRRRGDNGFRLAETLQ